MTQSIRPAAVTIENYPRQYWTGIVVDQVNYHTGELKYWRNMQNWLSQHPIGLPPARQRMRRDNE